MNVADRAARNEEIFREVNERIEEGADQHHGSGMLPFHCECVVETTSEDLVVEKIGEARKQSTGITRSNTITDSRFLRGLS